MKEMVIDFRKGKPSYSHMVIKGEFVEKLESDKYLDITIDNKLSWKQNINSIIKKTLTAVCFV